ncbi:MAG TPA: molybdopterin cofactor-binding domain-containing protein, partial [Allosphingosinicella sp.]|nr:molybdopterin cofactor-binding domain-containing protein [Allosphingosinicella sp.]
SGIPSKEPDAQLASGLWNVYYDIPNFRATTYEAQGLSPSTTWRSVGASTAGFFTESFIDELARTAGLEVLAFRSNMLVHNPRLARCLATAASIGGWDGGPPGSGMGLACHAAFGSYIAVLAEVEVTNDQRLRVVRAVVAVDCGRTINPEIVKQQIEGGLVHGISAATGRPIEIVRGTPTIRHIGEYGLPTLRDAPEVSVELLESEEAPGGVTELAVPVAGPAVANAYFSLTGQRARALPIQVGQRG